MMTDSLSPFVMYSARGAIAAGLTHVEHQVGGIEQAIVENPGLAFDLAKTLVESVCQRVLSERGIQYGDNDTLPSLFRAVSRSLPFLPPGTSGEAEVRNSLDRTLNGLQTVIQGICELRNRCGFASHGSADSRPVMESVQALLAAQAADAVVGFLYRVHRQDRTPKGEHPPSYEANPEFNGSVDELHGMVRIFDLEFRPSEVLYEMEPESYRVYLTDFQADSDRVESNAVPDEATKTPL